VLEHVARQYGHATLCSLTGKAASVIRRRSCLPAQTIHSFFYRLREVAKDKRGRDILSFCRVHNDMDLTQRLVLIDESSMISHEMAQDILRTGAKIIACGYPGQLPPVAGRQYFDRADFTLREIHRQALESPIIRQAHQVREGHSYAQDGDGFRVARSATDDELINAGIVLCWTNRTKDSFNRRCRRIRGIWQTHPQPGEPLVCLKNAPDYGVFNGGIYTLVKPFLERDTAITLDVDGFEIGWRDAGTGKLDLFRRFDLQDLSEATLFAVTVNAGRGATSTFDRQPCALIRCLRKTPT
jgi:exodeoxyribonuclease-5